MTRSSLDKHVEALQDAYGEALPYLVRYLAAWVPLAAAYMAVFLVTRDEPFGWSLLQAATNIALPLVLGIPVFGVVAAFVLRAHLVVQFAAHTALSVAYTTIWYALLTRLLSLLGWMRTGVWADVSFAGPALTWQLFQGLLLYGLIVAATYVIVMMVRGSYLAAGLATPSGAEAVAEPISRSAGNRRLFIKCDGELRPLDLCDIISISGADDYCEIRSTRRTDLIRSTLNDLEARLDPDCFIRVHRSHIINLECLSSVENRSGGGLTLIMQDGSRVFASRAGAASIKPLILS